MRRNLEIGNELTTLKEEIDIVKSYLEIQKFRYGDKISYEFNVPGDIDNYRIMPLIIQPIVENAVIHGLENMNSAGTVTVDIKKEGGFLRISVIDNGLGIENSKLLKIREALNDPEDNSNKRIGLKNVHQRLKLRYGDDYGLDITSESGHGAKIDITLPERGE